MSFSDEGSIDIDGTYPTIFITSSVIVSLATTTVVGRFLSKSIKRAPLTIDDALIVAAMVRTSYLRSRPLTFLTSQEDLYMDNIYPISYLYVHGRSKTCSFPYYR